MAPNQVTVIHVTTWTDGYPYEDRPDSVTVHWDEDQAIEWADEHEAIAAFEYWTKTVKDRFPS